MQCPKCKNVDLKPTKIDDGLPAMGCVQCNGAFISLLYYRDWAERAGDVHDAPTVELLKGLESEDSSAALNCPKCVRLMQKFRISGCSNNRLDLCTSCDEAWLDGGEWELLKALELTTEVPMVFSEQWQKKVRDQVSEEARRQRFMKILGEEDLRRADDFRSWLKEHPRRNDIMFYVNHK
ncbi:MAG: zf-TFIIB domain-containing protein [Kangiellaceae bacterium]|nr:zf-TFIIB domain-containing protein [Kangiellaceae bacterium]